MTYRQAVREFETTHRSLYINRADYYTAQFTWACYVDGLHRDGLITDHQVFIWSTPFKGNHLKPKRHQLEMEVYGE